MAKSRPTIMKRQRELARAEKRRDKAARRAVNTRADSGAERPEGEDDDYDPDIAHIVAGPQPIPWADEFPDEEEEEDGEGEEDGSVD
jgi:hypothetical protein